MTGTTLVTAGTGDITRQVLKFLVLEEVAGVLRLFIGTNPHNLARCRLSGG